MMRKTGYTVIQKKNRRKVSVQNTSSRRDAVRSIQAMRLGNYQGTGAVSVNRRRKRRSTFVTVSLCCIFFGMVAYGVMHVVGILGDNFSSQRIEYVKISGNNLVPTRIIRDTVHIVEQQTRMSEVDSRALEKKIERIPWIADAKVKRGWNADINIIITEQQAVALLVQQNTQGQQLYYLDQKGVPFMKVEPGGEIDFPVVTGISAIDSKQKRKQAMDDVMVFLKRLQRNNPQLPVHSLSEIHITKKGEMVIYLVEYPFPIFFGNGKIEQKYNRLVQVLKPFYKKRNGKREIDDISYIQIEYLKDKVLVTLTEGILQEEKQKPNG